MDDEAIMAYSIDNLLLLFEEPELPPDEADSPVERVLIIGVTHKMGHVLRNFPVVSSRN